MPFPTASPFCAWIVSFSSGLCAVVSRVSPYWVKFKLPVNLAINESPTFKTSAFKHWDSFVTAPWRPLPSKSWCIRIAVRKTLSFGILSLIHLPSYLFKSNYQCWFFLLIHLEVEDFVWLYCLILHMCDMWLIKDQWFEFKCLIFLKLGWLF